MGTMKSPAMHPAAHPATQRQTATGETQRTSLSRRGALRSLVGLAGAMGGLPLLARDRQASAVAPPPLPPAPWRPDHTVIVILENLSAYEATTGQREDRKGPVYSGSADWVFFNELAENGARFSNSHFGRTPYGSELPTRPSQPNYLLLFSGHHQGVLPAWYEDAHSPYQGVAVRDRQGRPLPEQRKAAVGVDNRNVPDAWLPFTSPNLGAAILQTGGSFLSFSESLPYPSWNCGTDSSLVPCSANSALSDNYRRKHNPAVNWTDQLDPTGPRARNGDPAKHVLPVSVNLGFEPTFDPSLQQRHRGFVKDAQGRPLGFDKLPDVCIVVPDEQHDGHSNSAKASDDWLRQNLASYAQWARTHNSLLIVTFDEDGSTDLSRGDGYVTGTHRIATLFYGAGIEPGVHGQRIDHLNVLASVLWLHGALDRFKTDFRRHYKVVDGSGSEAEKEWLNLQPVVNVFAPPATRASVKGP